MRLSMGFSVDSCNTCAFSPLQTPLQIERQQQKLQEQDNVNSNRLTANDVVNNLSEQIGEDASTAQKPDGSINYQIVQALLESNQTKQALENNSTAKQSITYQESLREPSQALGQILNTTA